MGLGAGGCGVYVSGLVQVQAAENKLASGLGRTVIAFIAVGSGCGLDADRREHQVAWPVIIRDASLVLLIRRLAA